MGSGSPSCAPSIAADNEDSEEKRSWLAPLSARHRLLDAIAAPTAAIGVRLPQAAKEPLARRLYMNESAAAELDVRQCVAWRIHPKPDRPRTSVDFRSKLLQVNVAL
jgi:hypothetical protein